MIVLDTHALIWGANGESGMLSPPTASASAAEASGGKIVISSIIAREVAILMARGRLAMSTDVAAPLALIEFD